MIKIAIGIILGVFIASNSPELAGMIESGTLEVLDMLKRVSYR